MTIYRLMVQIDLRELERLRAFVAGSAEAYGADERWQYRLQLVCEELVTNVISYGFPDAEHTNPQLEVRLAFGAGVAEVCITDNGIPFNPLAFPAPDPVADIERRPIGGLGIHIALSVSDRASYERLGECNVIRLYVNKERRKEERTG